MDAHTFGEVTRSPETAPQLFLLGWCQDYPDPHSWYGALFHSGTGHSSTGWMSAEYDRLVDAASAERDEGKRRDFYARAAQVLADDAPVAFLHHTIVSRLVKPWVSGLGNGVSELYEGQANVRGIRILMH